MTNDMSNMSEDLQSANVYKNLADKWYKEKNNSMALFRAQSKLTTPWILSEIRKQIGYSAKIIDISCGAGFFAIEAAKAGHTMTAMDISSAAIKVSEMYDVTKRINFVQGDAYKIPFSRESFDVVVGLDLIGNVSDPQQIFFEATRVLRPGGLFFFQAINKNFLSYFFEGKFPQYIFNKNKMSSFVIPLFRKPQEVEEWIEDAGMDLGILRGLSPIIMQKPFWSLMWNKQVQDDFKYQWTRGKLFNYLGYAKKLREH